MKTYQEILKKATGKHFRYEGKKYVVTAKGLEVLDKWPTGVNVGAISSQEFEFLQSSGTKGKWQGGFQSWIDPTYEQQHGTVAAVQAGKLDRPIRGDEIPMLLKKGISQAQLDVLGAPAADMSPAQKFREEHGHLPTREELIQLGTNVPTKETPGYEEPTEYTPTPEEIKTEREKFGINEDVAIGNLKMRQEQRVAGQKSALETATGVPEEKLPAKTTETTETLPTDVQTEMDRFGINEDVARGNLAERLKQQDAGQVSALETATGIKEPSALPALDTTSVVTQPGKVRQDVVTDLKSTTEKLKGVLDTTGATMKELLDRKSFGATTGGAKKMTALETQQKGIGTLTPEEETRVTGAGAGVESQYQGLVSSAEVKRRQGMASGLVTAAKAGGLDASAWVGISALVGEVAGGPAGFEGIGGKLAQMGSEYDRIIIDLKAEKIEAVRQAEEAERKAIMTDKEEDWNRSVKMYELAEDAHNDETNMLMNKQNVLMSYDKFLKDDIVAAEGEIQKMATYGVDTSELSPEEIVDLEKRAGLPAGTFEKAYKAYEQEYLDSVEKKLLEKGKTIFDIAKNLASGKSYTIPDSDPPVIIKGIKQDTPDYTMTEMVIGNKVYKIALDKDTGKEAWRVDTGKLSQTGKTVSWEMAKDLDDLSLYGKPVSQIPAGAEITGKETENFMKEAATLRGQLAQDQISWVNAFNKLKAKYNIPESEYGQLDKVLDRESHKDKLGPKQDQFIIIPK